MKRNNPDSGWPSLQVLKKDFVLEVLPEQGFKSAEVVQLSHFNAFPDISVARLFELR
jgi:hypothetical protein